MIMKNLQPPKETTIGCRSAAATGRSRNIKATGFTVSTKTLLWVVLLIFYVPNVFAQKTRFVEGTVSGTEEKSKTALLVGAFVADPVSLIGTQTNEHGYFSLSVPEYTKFVIVSYIGYESDTVMLLGTGSAKVNITLHPSATLNEVTVSEKLKTTEIGLLGVMKTEKIGLGELYKAACCNLGQSFETTPSIDVSFTDAVTGYRQIKLLGLAGVYTLITQENIPLVRGLASTSGLTFIPGSWMEGIQLSKGSGSVVNGYESTAGQINVELKKPFTGEKWFFDLYQGTQGNSQGDVVYRHNLNQNLGTMLMVDVQSQWLKVDLNKDHFIDQPLGNTYNIFNRWIYTTDNGWMFQLGVKAFYTHQVGGDWNYKEGEPQVAGNPWGYLATTQRGEAFMKIAKTLPRDETSVGLQLSTIDHNQQSQYGDNNYLGQQNSFYANLVYQSYIGNKNNVVKAGASEVLDIFNEQLTQTTVQQSYVRNESVPGVFAEYSGSFTDKFNIEAGLRADYDNLFGAFATPRLHLRYAPFKKTVFRASIGRAQRTANVFSDNIGYLASNRQIDILNPLPGKPYGLNPEVSWNVGGNLVQKFKYRYHEGVFTLDYYYTWFVNQVVVDVNYPQILNFYNLNGPSYAKSFQAQFDYELFRRFNIRLAYRYYDVKVTYYELGLQEKPFISPHRAFSNFSYATKNKWKFDYTLQWLSSERTPYATHNHGGSGSGVFAYSAAYYQMSCQITKTFNDQLEGYVGCDNMTNFMQHEAINDYAAPFSRLFDASQIWGPMMGVNGYVGIRYKIP